jgi:perosamine synthetase
MIPYGKHHINEDDISAVVQVLRSGALTQGPHIDAFEKAVADYTGAKYAVAVSSGTAGLHLAALAAGVGSGKSLVTSPITFVASANAGIYAGGSVHFADIDLETINMSPTCLRQVLEREKNVQAVVPVHFAGLPCDMTSIRAIADEFGATVIEDAAHALGATYEDGSRVGCCRYSAMTVFSFHPVKAIAAGEGGMITTNDETIYRKLLRLRSHGINKADDCFLLEREALDEDGIQNPWYYEMQELGFHYRITDIQCGLALSQFKRLPSFIARRQQLALQYNEAFVDWDWLRPVQTTGRERSGHHLYVVRIDFRKLGKSRGQVMRELRAKDIVCQVHYIPVTSQPFYKNQGFLSSDYPNSLRYYTDALSIPLYYTLTDKEQEYIVEALRNLRQ